MNPSITALLFYAVGSICFMVGTAINLWMALR